jgi:hypothetical protein
VTRLGKYWVIVYFGQFFNYKNTPQIMENNGYVLILTQNGSGYILGEFFTNSFVHPSLINEWNSRCYHLCNKN